MQSTYLLCEATTGEQLAMLDGAELTRRRTIATAALAADYLARPDARTLLVVGSGAVASLAAHADLAIRPITRIRRGTSAPPAPRNSRRTLCNDGVDASAVTDLSTAVAQADIVSCATDPPRRYRGGSGCAPASMWISRGFRPGMREADDALIAAGPIFIDTDDALAESGDLRQPLDDGTLTGADIRATVAELCRGQHAGRSGAEEITVFKSAHGADRSGGCRRRL